LLVALSAWNDVVVTVLVTSVGPGVLAREATEAARAGLRRVGVFPSMLLVFASRTTSGYRGRGRG